MFPTSRCFLGAGALLAGLAAALGAYGTHALATRLSAAGWSAFSTAVDYQFIHGLGLIGIAALTQIRPGQRLFVYSGWLLLAGQLLFCGSIYATTFGAPAGVGLAAPAGGTMLIAAWLVLALGAWAARPGGPADSLT
jgi:uncharacterized membrane protein YgdD (TMEM256/DUF423 family)